MAYTLKSILSPDEQELFAEIPFLKRTIEWVSVALLYSHRYSVENRLLLSRILFVVYGIFSEYELGGSFFPTDDGKRGALADSMLAGLAMRIRDSAVDLKYNATYHLQNVSTSILNANALIMLEQLEAFDPLDITTSGTPPVYFQDTLLGMFDGSMFATKLRVK